MGRRSASGTPISFFSFQDIITSVTGILILITLMLALEIVNPLVSEQMPADASGDPVKLTAQIVSLTSAVRQKQDNLKATSQAIEVLGRASPTTTAVQTMQLADASVAFEQLVTIRTTQLASAKRDADQAAAELKTAAEKEAALEQQMREAAAKLSEVSKLGNTKLLPGASTKKPLVIECKAGGIQIGSVSETGEVAVLVQATSREAVDAVTRFMRQQNAATHYFVIYVHSDAATLGSNLIKQLQSSAFDVGWDLLTDKQEIFAKKAP